MLTFRKTHGVAGSTETLQVMKRSANGGFTPYHDGYTGDEELACTVWPGEDRAASVTLPATWNSPSGGKIDVAFPLAAMTTLAPGLYQGMVVLADLSSQLAAFGLDVVHGVGTGTARKTYSSYQDLLDELSWIDTLQAKNDLAGFEDARSAAREWVDGVILSAVPTRTGRYFHSYERSWDWSFGGCDAPSTSMYVADALAADKLMIAGPNGRRIVRAATYRALSTILRRAVGAKSNNDLIALSSYYGQLAESTIISSIAEFDMNGDGVCDYVVLLAKTATH